MDLETRTYISVNASIEDRGGNSINLVASLFFFVTCSIGIMGNTLLLWTLGFRLKKTVNIIWFLTLLLSGLTYSMIMPILGVFVLLNFHWPFGTALCKLVNMLMSLCMYASVFLLTIISVDRYVLVIYPVWARRSRTPRRAMAISTAAWISAFILSAPYLAFREVQVGEKNKTVCVNNYVLSADWEDPEVQSRRRAINLSLFLLRLLLGFLGPFLVITSCYVNLTIKVKMRSLLRSSKLIKVITVSILSFFLCWTPYHLFHALSLYKETVPEVLIQAVMMTATICSCINVCFTPLFYLFIGEHFKAVFAKSLFSLIESTFHEELH